MKQRKAKSSPDTWTSKLLAALKQTDEPVPEGFYRADWYSEKWDLTMSHTRKLLYRGVSIGLLERKVIRASNNLGFPRKTSFFGVIPQKGKPVRRVKPDLTGHLQMLNTISK